MQYRSLGKTGLTVSEIGFGCGSVGGLMIRGEYPDMVRAVARAVELGVTYFDTARSYGNGVSETNLGKVLAELKPDVVVGTKVNLTEPELIDIKPSVIAAVEGSLQRLQLEQVDLIQLHNSVVSERQPERNWLNPADVAEVAEAFESLRAQGKVRFWGLNGLGETAALHQVVTDTKAQTIQTCYNLLNPSAGQAVPEGFSFQDYQGLIDLATGQGMGTIAIRVLAAGALSGVVSRHAVAASSVGPIASGKSYNEDVEHAQVFQFLVDEGVTGSLVEGAIRFVLSKPELSTAMVGLSNLDQLEQAVAFAEKGPLPQDVLDRLPPIWASF